MQYTLKNIDKIPDNESFVVLHNQKKKIKNSLLSDKENHFINTLDDKKDNEIQLFNRFGYLVYVILYKDKTEVHQTLEQCRKLGSDLISKLRKTDISKIYLSSTGSSVSFLESIAEGMMLAGYQFSRFLSKKNAKKRAISLKDIYLVHKKAVKQNVAGLNNMVKYTCYARDLINLPANFLNAEKFSVLIEDEASKHGIKVTLFNKKKIEALKMGGLLAVNKGSIDPPTFSVLEWKPKDAINKDPVILVGKGVMFDTGGLNLKTGNFMTGMKSDMSGAAVVASAMMALAASSLPLYVIALIPATDNRPDGNAHVPGDIIEMHDGTSVEIMNTDAEGRLILADALSYAKKYNPHLVVDIATLTGSAMRAIGDAGIIAMQTKAEKQIKILKEAGFDCYERIVELPLWDEFREMLKSEIADIANLGGANAGAITAGKFLEHFTDYPYIHLDIAGVALRDNSKGYISAGGTGIGVRLFYNFFLHLLKNKAIKDE